MNIKSFKDLSEQDLKLWSFSISIIDKQQIFWKNSSRIFIIFLFLLKFSRVFEIISCSFADLWFITRSAFYNLTTIIQLRNILIHFIRTTIFRNILYALIVTKEKSYIIEDVIAISCNFTFSSLSVEAKCISLLETREKIMQRMLYSTRLIRTSKSIEIINFYDDKYEFLNVRRDELRSHSWLTMNISVSSILIIISCDSYKRRKTLMKKICQRFMRSTDRKRQQMYRNSYFRLLRQRHCSSSSHNSLIKSIVSKVYLSRKIDFEKSMKRLKNFQNYNRLCKSRILRSSSHFILSRLKFHRLSRTLLYSCFARHCLTSDEC